MLLLLACAHSPLVDPSVPAGPTEAAKAGDHFVLRGGTIVGQGVLDVEVESGRIAAIGEHLPAGIETVDVTGRYLVPAFIDSHVHLAYLPEGEALADGGIAAAVDMAAPMEFLREDHGSLTVLASGPMITAVGGYPTQSWGRNGYGLACRDTAAAVAAVGTLADAGARLIKLPVTEAPCLDDDTLAAVVTAAHARGLKVASHALYADDVARAHAAGVDVLAHTPVETLPDPGAWSGRAVVSTLRAFGASSATIANLGALRAAGATVLYGTDFGNTRTAGIDGGELAAMAEAGLDGAAILAAGTSSPAAWWGLEEGVLAVGHPASVLVLARDPLVDPAVLATPSTVFIRGVAR